MYKLDTEKLNENALTSIRLGIEDFERSKKPVSQGGDPARALSAVRNLFAGVLLLFKYKIATSVDDENDAHSLIFNPPEVLPYPDGNGGVEWKPVGKFKSTTIDVATIKKRFERFGIEVDWSTLDKLQECRNHLEHLHPENNIGEVANFVAELFPILRDFILKQLNGQPAEILGTAWPIMLAHHKFFVDTTNKCSAAWDDAGVPEMMVPWLKSCKCSGCGSILLRPHQNEVEAEATVESDDKTFKYVCVACGNTDLIGPLMVKALNDADNYDPRDGGEPDVEECNECRHDTFIISEQNCLWCGAELDFTKCTICEEPLHQGDQFNGGLCDYHYHAMEKFTAKD